MIRIREILKKIIAMLFLIAVCLWCGIDIYDFHNLVESIGTASIVEIRGYLNNTSSFVLFGFFLPSLPLGLISVFTGLQYPQLTLRMMLFSALVFAIYGHYEHTELMGKLAQSNYEECTSKRTLALKYSSRTYVLPPATCD